MKKILVSILVLFSSFLSFAQNSAYTQSLEKLMHAKNGDAIFSRLVESSTQNIEVAKQANFKQKANKLAFSKQAEAVEYFTKKYSQADINEIYTEFTSEGRIDYTPKTLTFIREWRNFKGEFQKEFKELYKSM